MGITAVASALAHLHVRNWPYIEAVQTAVLRSTLLEATAVRGVMIACCKQ